MKKLILIMIFICGATQLYAGKTQPESGTPKKEAYKTAISGVAKKPQRRRASTFHSPAQYQAILKQLGKDQHPAMPTRSLQEQRGLVEMERRNRREQTLMAALVAESDARQLAAVISSITLGDSETEEDADHPNNTEMEHS